MRTNGSIAIFVHRQNIERYRRLLKTPLDKMRRLAILDLLAQEITAEQDAIRANDELAAAAMPQRIATT
jgi:hypothetical protein